MFCTLELYRTEIEVVKHKEISFNNVYKPSDYLGLKLPAGLKLKSLLLHTVRQKAFIQERYLNL